MTAQQQELNRAAAQMIVAALRHFGADASTATSGSGASSIRVNGLKVDGFGVHIDLDLEASKEDGS